MAFAPVCRIVTKRASGPYTADNDDDKARVCVCVCAVLVCV